jgi:lipopolysaccharide transport system ATP-binding protein
VDETVIRAEGLGKRYRIGLPAPGIQTLREAIVGLARGRARPRPGTHWALRDVSFEIRPGEVVGIIGRNGSGKSTLLKLLSRITEPTAGYADVCGRVASLLEVGTGFHSELTGRENIYLNGSILGMRRGEIERVFDEIVAFAEVERFLDTPVKHYSSGMYLRLAFAVAAHLEPDILIVDEVLAVGDAQFQKKCLGKMAAVSRGAGRTVLFVSHNMEAVQRLCSRCLLLDEGRLVDDGPAARVIARYLSASVSDVRPDHWIDVTRASRAGSGAARVTAVHYTSGERSVLGHPYTGGPLDVTLRIDAERDMKVGSVAMTVYSRAGAKLVNADSLELARAIRLRAGRNTVRLRIRALHLNPGVYRLGTWLAQPASLAAQEVLDYMEAAFDFDVVALNANRLGATTESLVPCEFDVAVVPDAPVTLAPSLSA